MINVGIIGYGKMGKLIHKLSKTNNNIDIISVIDPKCEDAQYSEINEESLKNVDVCIEFTHPSMAMINAEKIAKLGKNIVMGTTGWYDKIDQMEKIAKDNNVGIIWSGNFSLGVNLFFKMIKNAAKIINSVEGYDTFGLEYHHNKKADSPSGTANMIGKILINELNNKKTLVYDKLDREINPEELHIASVRGGSIPGTHIVGFDSTADTIELKHTARNREGFAMGSLTAAKWINEKKGIFNIDDMMNEIIGGGN